MSQICETEDCSETAGCGFDDGYDEQGHETLCCDCFDAVMEAEEASAD